MSLAPPLQTNSSHAHPPPGEHLQPVSFVKESKLTLALSLPLIAGQVSQMLMGIMDTVMIGKLGVVHLGAATLANTLLVVPLVLGIGLLASVSVRVSQAHGSQQPEEAGRMLRHGTWIAIAFGILTVVITALIIPLLGYMKQPPEVVARTPVYLMICAGSLIPALVSMTWKNHADALNNPWPPFWIILCSVGIDVFLNWVLIWGKFGFPAMGLEGAGWSTLFGRTLACIALFIWLNRSKVTRAWIPTHWFATCDWASFKSLLLIGVPASLQLLTEVSAFAGCTLLIGTLGAEPLAAHQVAINTAGLSFMVPLGIAMAVTVRVGESLGAGHIKKLHPILLGGWMFSTIFMTLSMLCFLIFGEWIASQYVEDRTVITIAAKLLIIAGLFQLVDGIQVVSASALRGINDVRIPAWLAFFFYWVIAIPLGAYLGLSLKWGAEGMWAGLAVGLGLAAIVLGLRGWQQLGRADREKHQH